MLISRTALFGMPFSVMDIGSFFSATIEVGLFLSRARKTVP